MTEFEQYLENLYKKDEKDEPPKNEPNKGPENGEKEKIEGKLPYNEDFKELCRKRRND